MVIDQGVAGLLGVLLGAALTSGGAIYRWYAKRRRYEAAISIEFRRAIRMIDVKLSWLERPLPPNVVEAVPDRIVRIDGVPRYLGEDEKFTIPLPFWQTNFNEIVSLLPAKTFLSFAATAELVDMFEAKFFDMKSSFLGTVGNPGEMAAACYQDLRAIRRRLTQTEGFALAQQGASADAPQAARSL